MTNATSIIRLPSDSLNIDNITGLVETFYYCSVISKKTHEDLSVEILKSFKPEFPQVEIDILYARFNVAVTEFNDKFILTPIGMN